MADPDTLRIDAGAVNARILAREAKTDFRRIEGASIKLRTQFCSAEGKRFYVRFFHSLQLNSHFIAVIGRTRFSTEEVQAIESGVRAQIDEAAASFDRAIDDVEKLFRTHGIAAAASYDTVPLELEVHVLSSTGRRFLELLGKLDQLMPLLQTLEIHEVVPSPLLDIQRASMKRQVRNIANHARGQASTLRRRMNEMARQGAATEAHTTEEGDVTTRDIGLADEAPVHERDMPAVLPAADDDIEGSAGPRVKG